MKIDPSFTIETQGLTLRYPSEQDFPFIFSATRYAGFNDGMPWDPPLNEDELIAPLQRSIKAWDEGTGFSFSIQPKESKTFLGRISIRQTQSATTWNIGFWTHPAHQGQGIMKEAVKGILDFGFTTLLAHRIEADYATWNKASEKVLHHNGMAFVKYIEKGFQKNGQWVDENQVAINRSDWES